MNRLKAYDYEFDNIDELNHYVKIINKDINFEEKSQATNQLPCVLFEDEKKYLRPINYEILNDYILIEKSYKVSNESMISYKGCKYSVPIQYVGKQITVIEKDNVIQLYYNSNLIHLYTINSNYRYNYKKDDYIDILKNSVFDDKNSNEIEKYIDKNLKSLDGINIDEGDDNYDR